MRTALFTVSFAGFWGQDRLTLDESIDLAADLGYDGVEIMGKRPHLSPLDYSLDDCRRLRDRLETRGLGVAAVAAYTDFGLAPDGEVPLVDVQVAYVAELAARASALGADLVRVFTSFESAATNVAALWPRTLEAIRACCDRAAPSGVRIGVQNHHDLAVDTRAYVQFADEVDRPNLALMYDCWSPALRGEDVVAHARALAPRMAMTTAADYIVLPRWQYVPAAVNYVRRDPPSVRAVPMGDGDLPYDAFFGALREGGFGGWVSYEMCSPLVGGGTRDRLTTCARRFLDYMDRHA
jgi:sugar phosphate isomerase/epimerase